MGSNYRTKKLHRTPKGRCATIRETRHFQNDLNVPHRLEHLHHSKQVVITNPINLSQKFKLNCQQRSLFYVFEGIGFLK